VNLNVAKVGGHVGFRCQRTEVRGQKSEDRWQKAGRTVTS